MTSNRRMQLIGAWCGGPLWMLLLFGGFASIGFVPPIRPDYSAPQLALWYQHHDTRLRIGSIVILFAMALVLWWAAEVGAQLKRIGGRAHALANAAFGCWVVMVVCVVVCTWLWLTISYRPLRDPASTLALSDFSWVCWTMTAGPMMLCWVLYALAILSDKRRTPIFPRWLAYLGFASSLGMAPDGITPVFFKTGQADWRGIIGFWEPTVAFGAFFVAMTVMLIKAIKAEPRLTGAAVQVEATAAEVPAVHA